MSEVEYGLIHHSDTEPHRERMTEATARAWIAEFEEDGGKAGAFRVIRRTIGPWELVDESSAGGAGSASPGPTPTTGASGVAPSGAPSGDLQRVLVRVFTALFPPTSEGPGGVIDYTDLPEHVRSVVRERDQLQVEVSKWALRAHKAGVPVALDHETGQWTVGDESSAGGATDG